MRERSADSSGVHVWLVDLTSGSITTAIDRHVDAGELAIFEPSNDTIDIHAEADTAFVLGSAAPHVHDLVLGPYSVHSSPSTLRAGERRLTEIQHRLQQQGRL